MNLKNTSKCHTVQQNCSWTTATYWSTKTYVWCLAWNIWNLLSRMRVICILQKDLLLLLPLLHLYPVENEHTWNERKKKKIRRKLEIAIECGSKITSFYHIFWPGWQCTLLLQQVTYLKIANAIWNNFLHCHPKFQFPICQFCTYFLLHSNSIKNAVCPWYSSFIGITFSYNIGWRLVYAFVYCTMY